MIFEKRKTYEVSCRIAPIYYLQKISRPWSRGQTKTAQKFPWIERRECAQRVGSAVKMPRIVGQSKGEFHRETDHWRSGKGSPLTSAHVRSYHGQKKKQQKRAGRTIHRAHA